MGSVVARKYYVMTPGHDVFVILLGTAKEPLLEDGDLPGRRMGRLGLLSDRAERETTDVATPLKHRPR